MHCAARLCVLLVLLGVLATPSTIATTYVVRPDGAGDFPTIQAAIDACVDGDVVELSDGEFTGDGNREIDLLSKAITLRSQSGHAPACIINCQVSRWKAWNTPFRVKSFTSRAMNLPGLSTRTASETSWPKPSRNSW